MFFVWYMLSFCRSDSCQNTFCLVSNRFKVKKPYIFSKNTFYPRILYAFVAVKYTRLCKNILVKDQKS